MTKIYILLTYCNQCEKPCIVSIFFYNINFQFIYHQAPVTSNLLQQLFHLFNSFSFGCHFFISMLNIINVEYNTVYKFYDAYDFSYRLTLFFWMAKRQYFIVTKIMGKTSDRILRRRPKLYWFVTNTNNCRIRF